MKTFAKSDAGQNVLALCDVVPLVRDQSELTELQELFILVALNRKAELEEEYINSNSGDSGGSKAGSGGKAGISDAEMKRIAEFKRLRDLEKNKK